MLASLRGRVRPTRIGRKSYALGVAAALLCALALAPSASALPDGFQNTLFANTPGYPTDITFLPDGRMLMTSLYGDVYVIGQGGNVAASPALTLPVCTHAEQGLLGIAVSPSFNTDHYVYIYYTRPNASAGCAGQGPADTAENTLSRFTMDPVSGTIDKSSETVLIGKIPAYHGTHNAGDVHFGKDGNIYVTVGDGGCYYLDETKCAKDNPAAQSLNTMQGKVLRITPTGGIPADNPFTGADSVRCNQIGYTVAGAKCQEIYAYGLRNPFRAAFDDYGTSSRFFVNDVGQETWEEVDKVTNGGNYGWSNREGPCNTGSTTDCPPPPAGVTDPTYAYDHSAGCSSITGGAFVPPSTWPSPYDGGYLYGDFVCGKLFVRSPAETGSVTEFDNTEYNTTAMTFGPAAGGGKALYVLLGVQPAEIRKIAYIGAGNHAPSAYLGADTTYGPAPLTVNFDASQSSDADGDALTYQWDFGDGSGATGTKPSHTYTKNGVYTARLTATDARGATNSASVRIQVGHKPVPVIDTPTASQKFAVGQQFTLSGHADDQEDGRLADSKLTWEVRLHHNTHYHPFLQPQSGNNIPFTTPSPEDLSAAANSSLEIRLTATDSDGLSDTVVQDFNPNKVTLSFDATPSGLQVTANELTVTTPGSVTSWEGYKFTVDAPTQTSGGRTYVFSQWSDGGAKSHTITTPSSAASYRATYRVKRADTDPPDFDGDGYSDLAVGAPEEDVGPYTDAGEVDVQYGGPNGITGNARAQQVFQSWGGGTVEATDRFGSAVTTGDFNGDGYSDLAVGATGEDFEGLGDPGVVNVIYGSPTGLRASSASQEITQSQAAGKSENGDHFGAALAAGDLDNDGRDDLVVGTEGENLVNGSGKKEYDSGAVNVLYGSSSGVSLTRIEQYSQAQMGGSINEGDQFGWSLAVADFDGDGYDDVAAGAPGDDAGAANSGAVNVNYGGASGLTGNSRAQMFVQSQAGGRADAGDHFGWSLAAGNFDGDSAFDLAIGSPDEDYGGLADAGAVNVLYGSTASKLSGNDRAQMFVQSQMAGLAEAGDRFGYSLAAGNFDGDGSWDLAAGAPNQTWGGSANAGIVNVQYGSSGRLTGNARARQFTQSQSGGLTESDDRFGAALTAGNFDGDGSWDLAIGAPDEHFDGFGQAGVFNVQYGSSNGIAGTRVEQYTQSQSSGLTEAGDRFGYAMR